MARFCAPFAPFFAPRDEKSPLRYETIVRLAAYIEPETCPAGIIGSLKNLAGADAPRPVRHPSNDSFRAQHPIRVMASMVVALSLLLAAVRLWPIPSGEETEARIYQAPGQVTIQMEEIVPTRQQQQTPPPPAPLPPVVVPDDVIVEEVELDFSDSFLPIEDPGDDTLLLEGDAPATTGPAVADTGPKPVRIVEPKYTRAAEKKKVRAEVVVEVLVDEKGRVRETRVLERFLLGKDDADPKQAVTDLGYGLEEAAIAAAEQWLFRPARQGGEAVRSYHTLTFKFGV